MAIGNGLYDPESMTDYGTFLYGVGLIDEEERDYFTNVSKLISDAISNKKWLQAFQVKFMLEYLKLKGGLKHKLKW